jgi:hypothetical protein
MFNLEKSIAEWRNQMLAAGIKSPVPLEELEIHLREEIEQQMKSGICEAEAFNVATQKIGHTQMVQSEFKKLGFRGVPMPSDCKAFRARFEIVFVCVLVMLLLPHMVLLLKGDGLNFLSIERLKLLNLFAGDLVFAYVIAKMFCRVTALGVSADGVSVSSTWLMKRHFIGWPDIRLGRMIRSNHLGIFKIYTKSGGKFTVVLSRTNADELIREIRRLAPQTNLQTVTSEVTYKISITKRKHTTETF